MFDTVSLGELLIDFTPRGLSEQGSYVFEANSGGAPCNVLAAMTKLGNSAAFIGKVGDDTFGHFLCDTLKRLNINTDSLYLVSTSSSDVRNSCSTAAAPPRILFTFPKTALQLLLLLR